MPKTLSVVVPTYNRRDLLPRVLAPLLRDDAAAEVVVVVDGSTDGTVELLERMAIEEPRLIPIVTENQGEDLARRTGVEAARGDVVLLLDDDVEPGDQLARRHLRHHLEREDVVVMGYMPLASFDTPTARLYEGSYEGHCINLERAPEIAVSRLWAGNLSIHREVYLEITSRPLRYRYDFHADRALSYRCATAGLVGVFDRECRATHHYSRSPRKYVGDAYDSGRSLVLLHDEFPEQAPFPEPDHFTRWSAGLRAALIAFTRRPRFARAALSVLYCGALAADAMNLTLADRALDGMAAIAGQRGAIDAARALAEGQPDRRVGKLF
jgi:glycosyltransferase involved in cell wall biosynthesis